METITVRGTGMTLDTVLFRRFGRRYDEVVEAALEANPGLADLGIELPLGTVITLPAPPEAEQTAPREVITLFG